MSEAYAQLEGRFASSKNLEATTSSSKEDSHVIFIPGAPRS